MKGELVEVVNVIRHAALFCLWAARCLNVLVLDFRTDLWMTINRVLCTGNSPNLRSSSRPFSVSSVQLVWGGLQAHVKETVDVQSLDHPAAGRLLRFLFSLCHRGTGAAWYHAEGSSLTLSPWTSVCVRLKNDAVNM